MARLVGEGQLAAFRHEGFFFAMDTYREYETLNRIWNARPGPLEGLAMNGLFSQATAGQVFNGRSVFVTGHTGFKGSWLSIWLHRMGARVTGYSLAPPTCPSNFEVSGVRDLLAATTRRTSATRLACTLHLTSAAAEVVFHLAAQPIVRESYANPRDTFDVNIMGTVNLLEAVRNLEKPCVVVVVTSDKCYENCEQVWGYRESDALGGHDPYSASKGMPKSWPRPIAVRSFRPATRQHGVKLATARAGNVIGGGDWAKDRIITDVVRHLASRPARAGPQPAGGPSVAARFGASGRLSGAGRTDARIRRPRLVRRMELRPPAGRRNPRLSTCRTVRRGLGRGSWIDASDADQPHEAGVLRLNIDKALHQLGWRPRWNVAEAVRRTAAWYRRFLRKLRSRTQWPPAARISRR